MGKLGPRLCSRKKAKRWAKGQSSSTNPETNKYRDQARSRFFQVNLGSTGLTTDRLNKHDALHGVNPLEKIEIDNDESTTAGTFNTFTTFASDFSNCSNTSFDRFQSHFQSSSLIHKEMLAILAAVTEVIKQQGGTESSTSYFAALMATLEQAETEESVVAILSLLGMTLKTIPKEVLTNKFSETSTIIFQLLEKHAATENFLILRHCIGCLSLLLRAQEAAMWSNSSTIQVLNAILAFTVHSKPKVRKAAQHAVIVLLKGSDLMKSDNNPPAYHPAASRVAEYCLQQFDNAGKPGTITTTLHILTLLKDITHQMSKSSVKLICENLLRIMTLNDTLIMSCCFQTFHSLFISKPPESVLPSELNAQIINALYDYQPAVGDAQLTLAWLAVMQEAYSNLVTHSVHLVGANFPKIIEVAAGLWLSDKTEIVSAATHTIKTLFQTCLVAMCENETTITKYQRPLNKVFQLIRQGLNFQYTSAWHHVLHVIAVLFQIAGNTCQKDLSPILETLAGLKDSHQFTYNSEVEYAVGAAIRSMGPELILAKIPLHTRTGEINLRRSWLLPVMKDCINKSSLSYFIHGMLPLVGLCEKKMTDAKGKNDRIAAHSYELLISQIWSLLPNFCSNACDVKENFRGIAKVLGESVAQRKDLRLFVMAGLRKLISRALENNNKEDIEELARFAKNYLPILFNLYTTQPNNKSTDEEGQRLAAFDTIKVYLKITPSEIITELFDKALAKLQDPENKETDFTQQAVFDLIRVLTHFADNERLTGLYEQCCPLLMTEKYRKKQKKAYRLLEEISGSESQVCRDFMIENRKAMQKLIIETTSTTCKTSKSARLQLIGNLIKINPQLENTKFFKNIVSEIVMCTKDLNEKCRSIAYQLLNNIADKFWDNAENFNNYVELLVAGLAVESSIYVSATLLALASLTFKFNGSIGIQKIQEILQYTCNLVTSPTREIVVSALSYLKVYLASFPTPIIGPNLPIIIEGLIKMTEDCKRHFRQKTRDIIVKLVRKFDIDIITNMVPASEEMMHKRLKNIRKIEARKQKAKEQKKAHEENKSDGEDEFEIKRKPKSVEEILADSDEEFDDIEADDEEVKRKKKKGTRKTWIQEGADNIVDLADPSAAKNITATKPGQSNSAAQIGKSKNHGFKSSEDGRLIINDSDDSENEKRKKKKKLPFLGSDSEDDYENDDKSVMSTKTVRKRKLSEIDDGASSVGTLIYQPGGRGIHRPTKMPKLPGAEYKSKKAMGDVKRKDKPAPYAYLPLTRADLNKRKKMKNTGRFHTVIGSKKNGRQKQKKNLKK